MPAVLYVDDSSDDLFYARYTRDKWQLEIDLTCLSTTQAAQEALEALLADGRPLPDILIVDLYMPLDSGISLISRLRADNRFKAMRLGVCSGSDAREDHDRAMAAGADFYVEKPLDLKSVASR